MRISGKLWRCVFGVLTVCALPLESRAQSTDTTPPQVTITSPTAGAMLSGSVKLTATATDDVGVQRVIYTLADGRYLAEAGAPFEAVWSTPWVPVGTYTLTARAYDASGHVTTSAGVTVQVK